MIFSGSTHPSLTEEIAEQLARLGRLELSEDSGDVVAVVAVPGGTVEVLANTHVNLEQAERKLEQRRAHLLAEIQRAEKKLANRGFTDKAPPALVDVERQKLKQLKADLEAL